MGSKMAMEQMLRQGHGAIYNMEGYGSNDAWPEYVWYR